MTADFVQSYNRPSLHHCSPQWPPITLKIQIPSWALIGPQRMSLPLSTSLSSPATLALLLSCKHTNSPHGLCTCSSLFRKLFSQTLPELAPRPTGHSLTCHLLGEASPPRPVTPYYIQLVFSSQHEVILWHFLVYSFTVCLSPRANKFP